MPTGGRTASRMGFPGHETVEPTFHEKDVSPETALETSSGSAPNDAYAFGSPANAVVGLYP